MINWNHIEGGVAVLCHHQSCLEQIPAGDEFCKQHRPLVNWPVVDRRYCAYGVCLNAPAGISPYCKEHTLLNKPAVEPPPPVLEETGATSGAVPGVSDVLLCDVAFCGNRRWVPGGGLFCSAHTCSYPGCSDRWLLDRTVCAFHACKAVGCKRAREVGSSYCGLGICDKFGCYHHVALPDSSRCADHQPSCKGNGQIGLSQSECCAGPGCSWPRLEGKVYCEACEAKFGDRPVEPVKVASAQCQVTGCIKLAMSGAKCCSGHQGHVCTYKGCWAPRVYARAVCAAHTCGASGCTKPQLVGSRLCGSKVCPTPGCYLHIEPGSAWCVNHMPAPTDRPVEPVKVASAQCQVTGCIKLAMSGAKCCSGHQGLVAPETTVTPTTPPLTRCIRVGCNQMAREGTHHCDEHSRLFCKAYGCIRPPVSGSDFCETHREAVLARVERLLGSDCSGQSHRRPVPSNSAPGNAHQPKSFEPTASEAAAAYPGNGLLPLFSQAVAHYYRKDPSAAGVQFAWLADEKKFYVAIHRYREKWGKGREVVLNCTHTNLYHAVRELANNWQVTVNSVPSMHNVRRAILDLLNSTKEAPC